ncbi:hypothetical protein HPULCUR_010927 [Helicostylum pulchrum]|uniref:Uncharacterized protein n=1 Tax=Helicostylum pulchrum TaxID=562976 RepID=A0ABP9YEN2_9FUNG
MNEGLNSSDQANCNINFLQMEHIIPAKNLVYLVATHLRNTEIVSLKAKDWSSEYNSPVIDLTRFKKLKSFIYTSTDKCFTEENKFVLIKYTNGTEHRVLEYGETMVTDGRSFTVLCDISVSLISATRKS